MTINKFNYEGYALDYLEGNLSPAMVIEMERFLKTHPAIEAELSGMMELIILEPDPTIVFEGKEDLLKKEAKVAFLNRRWIRPLIAAASIALLISTYFLGYQAGNNQTSVVKIVEGNDKIDKTEHEIPTNPAIENVLVEKEAINQTAQIQTNNPQIIPLIEQKKVVAANNTKPTNNSLSKVTTEAVSKNETTFSTHIILEDVPELPTVIAEKNLEEANKDAIIAKKTASKNITFIKINTLAITPLVSNNQRIPDLRKALKEELPIDKELLVLQQTKKRSFKDLLGKFPITNLKEALIPSYYREGEEAGQ